MALAAEACLAEGQLRTLGSTLSTPRPAASIGGVNFDTVNITFLICGSFHHGMARAQVADGGMVSNTESSC